jgi:hypothetical protein
MAAVGNGVYRSQPEVNVLKSVGFMLLFVGASSAVVAGVGVVPEIDAASGVGALVLLSGALLVLRARRK